MSHEEIQTMMDFLGRHKQMEGGGLCPAGYAHTRPDDWQDRTGSPGDCVPVDVTAAEVLAAAAAAAAVVGDYDKKAEKIAKWLSLAAAALAIKERQDAERDKE